MSNGQFIYKTDRTPPHECVLPQNSRFSRHGSYGSLKPDPEHPDEVYRDDVWMCECGRRYDAYRVDPDGEAHWKRIRRPLWMTRENQRETS